MKVKEIEFIPDRLIEEPVVFRGLTDTEVIVISVGTLIFCIPSCVILLAPFGLGMFGVSIGFASGIISLLVIGKYLQKLKRKMPDGLHVVYLKKLAQKKIFFLGFGYIETSQSWGIRRDKPVIKIVMEAEE